jgi:hypothetical protein
VIQNRGVGDKHPFLILAQNFYFSKSLFGVAFPGFRTQDSKILKGLPPGKGGEIEI